MVKRRPLFYFKIAHFFKDKNSKKIYDYILFAGSQLWFTLRIFIGLIVAAFFPAAIKFV